MFLGNDLELEPAGGAASLPASRALVAIDQLGRLDRLRGWAAGVDWVPDLGANIGSATWWRGAATCFGLIAAAWSLGPSLHDPIPGISPAPLAGTDYEQARATAIAPLAFGGTTGTRFGASDLVRPLTETPERPTLELSATLRDGDAFKDALVRVGVGADEAARAADLVSTAVALGDLKAGTRLNLTLGRRESRTVARPLEKLAFRARFDLNLALARQGGELALIRQPISIDHTPLRIEGLVGPSLYRSARAAGAPAEAVATYLKALATRLSVGRDITASDKFTLVLEQKRAATGEVQLGNLALAGIVHGGKPLDLVRWGDDGHTQWYDARGMGQTEGGALAMPVAGHITSTFGLRFHPILHVEKFHKGLDIGAAYGSPIHAAIEGVVNFAGRKGGYGNFVQLSHGGGLQTGYGHMSRIAVRAGERVSRGEVIGYVGSTGLSTGPHLHWEVLKNGTQVNPMKLSYASVQQLSGAALHAFRAKVAELLGR